MRNRLLRENQATDCQEIEELRSICCEETDPARQARIDELSMQQERNPTTVSRLLTQIQVFTEQSKFLLRCERILRSFHSEQLWSDPRFPVNPLLFRVPGPCLAAILDCRTIHRMLWVLQETFLNDYLLKKDEQNSTSRIQRVWLPLLKN